MNPVRRHRLALATTAVVAVLATPPSAAGAERVIVRFAADATAAERSAARAAARVSLVEGLDGLPRTQVLHATSSAAANEAVTRLEADDDVLWAERDVRMHATRVPDDPRYGDIWGLSAIGAPAAWDVTTGSAGVTVAVVDSGVSHTHPDLEPQLWRNPGESGGGRETNRVDDDENGLVDDVHGYDFWDLDAVPEDLNGHGTHVAGTIAARGNDGAGMAGVSWTSRIMALRALGPEGHGWASDIAQSVAYAARNGAKVVNMSLGGAFSHALDDAITGAPHVLVVAAAGNSGADLGEAPGVFPCELPHPNVVCVAATESDDALASYSNFGPDVDLAAPGSGVLSASPARRVVLGDDFEDPGLPLWQQRNRWARSTAQSSSGSHGFAVDIGAPDPPGAQGAFTSYHDVLDGVGHCRFGLRAWLDASHPEDRLEFSITPSLGFAITGSDGDVNGQWVEADLDPLAGPLGSGVYLAVGLVPGAETNRVRGAVDDVAVRCVDPGEGASATGFERLSGTSMATPFVSGAAALLYARSPGAAPASVRAALLAGVDRLPGLSGKVESGGRLNASRALAAPLEPWVAPPPPGPPGRDDLPLAGDGPPGSIDTTFGDGGVFRTRWPGREGFRTAWGIESLPLPDGRTLVTGVHDDAVVLVRLLANGALDPSFGDGGRVRESVTSAHDGMARVGGLARLPDGRIIVGGGRSEGGKGDVALLLRFLPDGRLDPAFGTGGQIAVPLGRDAVIDDPDVDASGRIVAAFRADVHTNGIARFDADGRLDRTFADGGTIRWTATDPDGDGIAKGGLAFGGILVLPNGRLQGAGCAEGVGDRLINDPVAMTVRLLPEGRGDPAFGSGGFDRSFPVGSTGLCIIHHDLAPDGGVVLAGAAFRGNGGIRPFIARLQPDGAVDQRFGLNGIVYLPDEPSIDSWAADVVALRDGRVVIIGLGVEGRPVSLVRLLPDGRLDPTFGAGGLAPVGPADAETLGSSLALDGAGRLLVTGNDGEDLLVARFRNGRVAGETPPPVDPGPDPDPPAGPGTSPPANGDPAPDRARTAVGTSGEAVAGQLLPEPLADLTAPARGTVRRAVARRALTVRLRGRTLTIVVFCASQRPCRRRVVVHTRRGGRRGRRIASRRVVVGAGRSRTLRVRLRSRGVSAYEIALHDATSRRRLSVAEVARR